jgi:MoaA/NifB/PqqE/SkfB family radical SAM enzyme
MKRLDIKISYSCNNACLFCVQGDKRCDVPAKPNKEIKNILRQSRKEYGEVVFTGGDPAIHPDILELVRYAKSLCYHIQIQTNGRMFFYPGFCHRMIRAGANVFAVSIHGHHAKLHDFLTGAPGSFEQTTTGIKNLIRLGQIVVTNTVINNYNYRFLPQIADYLIKIGVPQYQLAFPHIMGSALVNRSRIVPRKSKIMPYVKKAIKIGTEKRIKVLTEAIPFCFLDGFEQAAAEKYIPEAKTYGITITDDFNKWRREEGKVKGPNCVRCKHFQACEGPWKEYPELYGWKEFIPVK